MKKETLVEIIAIWFIVLFMYTAISKLLDYAVFKEQIALSPLLEPVASWISWTVPISELAVAVLLFIPAWRRKGMYGALILMVGFTIYVAALIAFDDNLPCSCGGIIELLSWRGHLIFNGLCCLLAATAILLNRPSRSRSMPAMGNQ